MGEHALPRRRSTCKIGLAILSSVLVLVWAFTRCSVNANPPDVVVTIGSVGWEAKLQNTLAEHGYAHMPGLLNRSEVQALREIANTYCYGNPRRALPLAYGGYSVPGFLDIPEFAGARWLPEDPRLHKLLRGAFNGTDYRFASHNDVGCDFVGVWHKDVLRGNVAKFQECDVWSRDEAGEQHEIYKMMFYLQDHDHDEQAMKVLPGSHLLRRTPWEKGYVALHPRMGDCVMFDQRISHAGNHHYNPFGLGRLFMQVGFGKKNRFTTEFERGTIDRQQQGQARMLKGSPQPAGLSTFFTDLKFSVLGAVFTALPPRLLNHFADTEAVSRHLNLNCGSANTIPSQQKTDL